MAAKRTASNDLNHCNWDREDEPEEAGSFSKASEDKLKNRVIKVAKRRNPTFSPSSSDDNKGLFSSFSGFSKPPSTPSFGFLISSSNKEEVKTNGLGEKTNVFKSPEKKTVTENTILKKSEEYYAKLKGLNQTVSSWIQNHVNTNPFINLHPIFKDYEKYIDNLDNTYKDVSDTSNKVRPVDKPVVSERSSIFGSFASTAESKEVTKPTFTFGNVQPTSSSFSSEASKPFTAFGADSSKSFSFANVAKPVTTETETQEDEDEPPKVEFTPVVEEGHIYSVRCKVFVRKDGQFGERGVGNLYLKPIPDSEKVQLIVRADTNLGNLICNLVLTSGIPIKRMGKKDVMMACIPTPDSKPPPVPVLFRVKSPEEADELLKVLESHQK